MYRTAALALLCIPAVWGQTAVQRMLEDKVVSRIRDYDSSLAGVLGVASIDLTTGRMFVYNGDAVFPTASSIKIPILVEMFRAVRRGDFKLSESSIATTRPPTGASRWRKWIGWTACWRTWDSTPFTCAAS